MKQFFKNALLTLAIVFTGALTSTADTVSYQLTGSANTAGTDFSLSQFNPSLGTLTGITLTISGSDTGSFTITNNLGSSDTVSSPKDNFVTLTYVSEGSPTSYLAINKTLKTGDTFPFAIGAFQQLTFTLNNNNAFSLYTDNFSDESRWAAYIGTGVVDFTVDNSPQVTTSGGFYTANTTGVESVETFDITYTYTAVPEPSTWACLILGGMLVLARCRQSKLVASRS